MLFTELPESIGKLKCLTCLYLGDSVWEGNTLTITYSYNILT